MKLPEHMAKIKESGEQLKQRAKVGREKVAEKARDVTEKAKHPTKR